MMDIKKKKVLRNVLDKFSGVKPAVSGAYKNVVDKTASVLSAPSRALSAYRGNKAQRQTDIIKTARAYDDAPNWGEKGPTDAMKMRVAAENIINPPGTKKIRPGINRQSLGWK